MAEASLIKNLSSDIVERTYDVGDEQLGGGK